jgi:hypothetical protein
LAVSTKLVPVAEKSYSFITAKCGVSSARRKGSAVTAFQTSFTVDSVVAQENENDLELIYDKDSLCYCNSTEFGKRGAQELS